MVEIILSNSRASFLIELKFSNGINSASSINSNQKTDSSDSSRTIHNLENFSASERPLVKALKFAATEVDERRNCLPIILSSSVFLQFFT